MISFGEKAKIKQAGNLNQGRSYVITTVPWVYAHVTMQGILNKIIEMDFFVKVRKPKAD